MCFKAHCNHRTVAEAVILLVQILHLVVWQETRRNAVNRAFPAIRPASQVCFKTHSAIPTGKAGDFRDTEITRRVQKLDSRRSAVNWGFFGSCRDLKVCFKAHLYYFERTIVLCQIATALSGIWTAAVAAGDSAAIGNTIGLLSLNQRIRFPA